MMRMRFAGRAAMVLAVCLLAAGATSATARRIRFNVLEILATWAPITLTLQEGLAVIRCNLTLEGRLDREVIDKVVGSRIGTITRARISHPCAREFAWVYNGTEWNEVLSFTLVNFLPFHIKYLGFTGTLPNIQALNISIDD